MPGFVYADYSLLSTASRQWSRAIPPGPRPSGRYGHTLNILGSKLYIFGGQVEGYFFNDLVAFDLNALQNPNNRWEFLIRNSHEGGPPPGQIPPARTNHSMVTYNDKLYLFGGTNGVNWFNDMWSYDPRTNQWTELECNGFLPTPREGHAVALVGDTMYVFGGRTDEGIDLGDLAAFKITTRRWFSFHNMGPAPSPRSGHSMTTLGKSIIVLGGEPSSAPRDPAELSLAYVLDTTKIRYPSEPGSSAPNGERVPGGRKMSGEKLGSGPPPSGRSSREAQRPPMDPNRRAPGPARDSALYPGGRPQPEYGPAHGGSRLPRASIAQAPSGPPPPGQAPTPQPRNNGPPPAGSRSRTPPRQDVGPSQTAETGRDLQSPGPKDSPREGRQTGPEPSSAPAGRRTPTQQSSKLSAKAMEAGEAAPLTRQRSLQRRQRASMESTDESVLGRQPSLDGSEGRSHRNSRNLGDNPQSPRLTPQQEALIKELESARTRIAWYASELALARKAGYTPNPPPNSSMDDRAVEAFSDEDRPLIEAFLSMRAELAKMQATVDRQAAIAAKRVAEVEHQRDVAISEAAYARAKLAAHGAASHGASQQDGSARAPNDAERMADLSRRLALALASQSELKAKIESLTSEVEQEKRARELAEETNEATAKRLAELEMQNNPLELESVRTELHHLQARMREETALRSEAEANLKQASLDKEELKQRLEEASSRLRDHGSNINSLREALEASAEKANLLERHLEEERERREGLERKLLQLRAEHEERTAELENTMRRLKDAEELAESHAREAESHKLALMSGLDRTASFDADGSLRSITDQRVVALQSQVKEANELAKANQAAADEAADKLRRAEERIAGLEAYQEQVSREGLQLRRQLQAAIKESQALAAENKELKIQLESQQREASALAIQHGALKDLLGERGMHPPDSRRSPMLESPGSRFGTPEQSRLRELEQQLQASLKAHEECKAAFETREQEADRAYREKLEQLENDYQSAVHYVKGTEKMLKRMKDELAKYKSQTAKLQSELEQAHRNAQQSAQSPEDWESERRHLQQELSELQASMTSKVNDLDRQVQQLREDLAAAQRERDESRSAKQELIAAVEQSRAELEELKNENSLLESRALNAEQKVTMLLDQVEASVGNYRRQSQLPGSLNGLYRSHSSASTATIGAGRPRADSNVSRDDSFLDNRGSMALDSLANELDALRSQWENTHRNYRFSTSLDFERTPTKESADGIGISEAVANWRRRLDEEEARASTPIASSSQAAAGKA